METKTKIWKVAKGIDLKRPLQAIKSYSPPPTTYYGENIVKMPPSRPLQPPDSPACLITSSSCHLTHHSLPQTLSRDYKFLPPSGELKNVCHSVIIQLFTVWVCLFTLRLSLPAATSLRRGGGQGSPARYVNSNQWASKSTKLWIVAVLSTSYS